ncbi:MAG TPA: efflux RND transporter periplasmic adaptor subunit [Verrucomicrobiota bacterium]|nr:efflux RND transporter periplasmic adaptor subunit [Verrucomicrobiota bacterium]
MKKWIAWIVVLALGYLGYTQWDRWQEKRKAAEANGRPTTAPVIQTNINFAVNAAGEIVPAEQVSVRPEINGRIELLPVDVGDQVKKGALLFKLDDKELRQQYESAVTSVERAKLELAKAERDYQRARQLLDGNLISQELYDDTKTAYELSKNSLERAQREQALTDERLTKTEVRAPFDCTVLTRPISAGQAVSGSGGFNSGTEVLSIADLNAMVINAHVNQADVPRLRVGQEVEVAVEAVSGLRVTGIVERISPQASIKNNIKGFAARVLLKNVDQRVRPGMTTNVKIPVASAENVLAVPLAAVFTEKNEETGLMERYVFVQKGGGFERRPVQVGVADFFYAEVQQGLSPGDLVAIELPKEERDKPAKAVAGTAPGAGTVAGGARAAVPAGATNRSAAVAPAGAGAGGAGRGAGAGGAGAGAASGGGRPGGGTGGSAPVR